MVKTTIAFKGLGEVLEVAVANVHLEHFDGACGGMKRARTLELAFKVRRRKGRGRDREGEGEIERQRDRDRESTQPTMEGA